MHVVNEQLTNQHARDHFDRHLAHIRYFQSNAPRESWVYSGRSFDDNAPPAQTRLPDNVSCVLRRQSYPLQRAS